MGRIINAIGIPLLCFVTGASLMQLIYGTWLRESIRDNTACNNVLKSCNEQIGDIQAFYEKLLAEKPECPGCITIESGGTFTIESDWIYDYKTGGWKIRGENNDDDAG